MVLSVDLHKPVMKTHSLDALLVPSYRPVGGSGLCRPPKFWTKWKDSVVEPCPYVIRPRRYQANQQKIWQNMKRTMMPLENLIPEKDKESSLFRENRSNQVFR